MDTFRAVLWLAAILVVVFELRTMIRAWSMSRSAAISILTILSIQILPPPILMYLDATHPQPYHDVPWNLGPYGVALLLFIVFLFVVLVPCGAIMTFAISRSLNTTEKPNQMPEDTARKLADPQH